MCETIKSFPNELVPLWISPSSAVYVLNDEKPTVFLSQHGVRCVSVIVTVGSLFTRDLDLNYAHQTH